MFAYSVAQNDWICNNRNIVNCVFFPVRVLNLSDYKYIFHDTDWWLNTILKLLHGDIGWNIKYDSYFRCEVVENLGNQIEVCKAFVISQRIRRLVVFENHIHPAETNFHNLQ